MPPGVFQVIELCRTRSSDAVASCATRAELANRLNGGARRRACSHEIHDPRRERLEDIRRRNDPPGTSASVLAWREASRAASSVASGQNLIATPVANAKRHARPARNSRPIMRTGGAMATMPVVRSELGGAGPERHHRAERVADEAHARHVEADARRSSPPPRARRRPRRGRRRSDRRSRRRLGSRSASVASPALCRLLARVTTRSFSTAAAVLRWGWQMTTPAVASAGKRHASVEGEVADRDANRLFHGGRWYASVATAARLRQ